MVTVPDELCPMWTVTGELSVLLDGNRFSAHVEDGQLIVRGVVVNGVQLPAWRPGFVIRVDGSAQCELRLSQLLVPTAEPDAIAPA